MFGSTMKITTTQTNELKSSNQSSHSGGLFGGPSFPNDNKNILDNKPINSKNSVDSPLSVATPAVAVFGGPSNQLQDISKEDLKRFLMEYTVRNARHLGPQGVVSYFFVNRENNLQTTIDQAKATARQQISLCNQFENIEKVFFSSFKKANFTSFASRRMSNIDLDAANNFFFEEADYAPSSQIMNKYIELIVEFAEPKKNGTVDQKIRISIQTV